MKITDSRDRIYAFMALETADGVMARKKISSQTMRGHTKIPIFSESAHRYLQETADLDSLTYVNHYEHDMTTLHGVASCVPQCDNADNVFPAHVHDTSCQPKSSSRAAVGKQE